MPQINSCVPLGLQISRECDRIYKLLLQQPEEGDRLVRAWCKMASEASAPPLLRESVFGLMGSEDLKHFLLSPDNQMWHDVQGKTESFLSSLDAPGKQFLFSSEEFLKHFKTAPENTSPTLQDLKPVVMDHTLREPATSTPFGHTGRMKYLTLQIIRKLKFKDIAVSGQYYGQSYTPETQVLEEMQMKGDSMDGMIIMFAPNREDRKAGIHCIQHFGIPNAFLDLTLQPSIRFAQADFKQSVKDAVEELDAIFKGMENVPHLPWRSDQEMNGAKLAKGEISLNLVDIMEFLDLQQDGSMDQTRKSEAEQAFREWKQFEPFKRRVVAILFEEGRGRANYVDYGRVARWLVDQFPKEENYRVLVHAHGSHGNTQDAASIEAALNGASGVWAALIPQAAQAGHNSSMVFLDNLLQMGNEHVLDDFHLHQAAQCARHIYYMNYNTYRVPDDCPIWGRRNDQLTHLAFSVVDGEKWRQMRRGAETVYNVWGASQRERLGSYLPSSVQVEVEKVRIANHDEGQIRISPLVSNSEIWRYRMEELPDVLRPDEKIGDFHQQIRTLSFALMNANIRANFDERETLKKLADIVRRMHQQKFQCPEVEKYLKVRKSEDEAVLQISTSMGRESESECSDWKHGCPAVITEPLILRSCSVQ